MIFLMVIYEKTHLTDQIIVYDYTSDIDQSIEFYCNGKCDDSYPKESHKLEYSELVDAVNEAINYRKRVDDWYAPLYHSY